MVVGGQWSVVSGQWWSVVSGGRWSVVGGQWSVVSVVNGQSCHFSSFTLLLSLLSLKNCC